jgi:hypothetical protein
VGLLERRDTFPRSTERRVIEAQGAQGVTLDLAVAGLTGDLERLLAEITRSVPSIDEHQQLAVSREDARSGRTGGRRHRHRLVVRPKCSGSIGG